jgi:SAM-dependent methyltransferase
VSIATTVNNPPQSPDQNDISHRWPAAVMAAFTAALAFVLPPNEMILETCIGTTRIADALRERSRPVLGLSPALPLDSKSSSIRAMQLVRGSLNALPFRTATFGGVYQVNDLDQIANWETPLGEIRRVLRRGGVFVHATGDEAATDITNHMEVGWETILRRNEIELNGTIDLKGRAALESALGAVGSTVESFAVCRWSEQFSPRHRLDMSQKRLESAVITIRSDRVAKCLRDYERWLNAQYGDLDSPLELIREIVVHAWRFDS